MFSSVSNYRNVLTCNEAFGILIMGISLHLYSCGFMNGRLIICCKQPCNNKGWRVLFVVCTKVFRHGSYTCTPCVSGFLVVMQLALINVRNSAHVMTLVFILVYAYVATLESSCPSCWHTYAIPGFLWWRFINMSTCSWQILLCAMTN